MPKGVSVIVEDGFAELDFTDTTLRAVSLGKLIALGGAESIETDTGGRRRTYRVPEGNARAVGLLDDPGDTKA